MIDRKFELILVFQTGKLKGQRAKVHADRIVLGRSDSCEIILDEEGVSRQHALITFQRGKYFVEDLRSENGVIVNKKKISLPQVLYHKDVIQCGTARFGVLIPGTVSRSKKLTYESEKLDIPTDLGPAVEAGGKLSVLKNKRLLVYGAIGLVVLLLIVLMSGEEEPPPGAEGGEGVSVVDADTPESPKDITAESLEKEIVKKQKLRLELMQKQAEKEKELIADKLLETKSEDSAEDTKLRLAREKYHSGIKELMAQNYVQAEQEFQLSLALNDKDLIVSEYLLRTRRKRRAVAEDNYLLGKNYFSSLQYGRAMSHFRNVINLLEIEKQNLDHESKGYVAMQENAGSYLERARQALEEGVKK